MRFFPSLSSPSSVVEHKQFVVAVLAGVALGVAVVAAELELAAVGVAVAPPVFERGSEMRKL